MPVYVYECSTCWRIDERILPTAERDELQTCACGQQLRRIQAPAGVRVPGGRSKINYADQFTADALGIPVKDLPSGLKTEKPA